MRRIRSQSAIALFLTIFFLSTSCEKTPTENEEESGPLYSYELIGRYTNPTGTDPQFTVITDTSEQYSTHEFITFDGVPVCSANPSSRTVSITLNMVSISGEGANYYIDSLRVDELASGSWREYPEFSVEAPELLTEIAVVLVLDVSSSLGSDFLRVQEYAKQFVTEVKENALDARIGIVSFSTQVDSLPLTFSKDDCDSYISSLTQGEYTKMYDAMKTGIRMLGLLETVEGKAIVTFTDGKDNYSTATPDEVTNLLIDSGISSYTIGLRGRGGVESDILQDLAVNGRYGLANSMTDLAQTFDFFARSISQVYRVTYIRNDQRIVEPRLIRFTFMQLYEY